MENEIRPDTLSVTVNKSFKKLTPAKRLVADKVAGMLANEETLVKSKI